MTIALSGDGQTPPPLTDGWPPPDSTADVVIGQTDFVTGTSGLTQTTLNYPDGIAIDTTVTPNILYIADYNNHRILGYNNYPFIENGGAADFVIGQSDFTSNTSGITALKFNNPYGIAVDSDGNLWVSDYINNRVLVFQTPYSTDYSADFVFGQGGSFTTNTGNNGGISNSSLLNPTSISFDNNNRVFISDYGNNRILIYNDPLNLDTNADWVIGQPDFSSNGAAATDSTLDHPNSCSVLMNGDLLVADYSNNRILKFIDPINTDKKADQVFGQGGSFTTGTANNPSRNSESLSGPLRVGSDKYGNIYVSDSQNYRVLVFSSGDTTADYIYGQNGNYTTNTSSVTSEGLSYPGEMVRDKYDNLVIADKSNNRVLIYKKSTIADIYLTAADLNFPALDIGLTDTLDFMIMNSGNDTLFVDSLRIQSTNGLTGNSFTIVDMIDTITASPLDTMFIDVAFNPVAATSYLDSLVIYHRKSSVSATEIMTMALTGDGQTPPPITGGWPPPDSTADVVIGQTDFITGTSGISQTTLNSPTGIAIDTTVYPNILYINDYNNNRILGYYNYPLINSGAAADFVIGQPDFVTNTSGTSNSGLTGPRNINVDEYGNLWVADKNNHRVLVFISPTTTDYLADYVFGQGGSFTSNTQNNSGISDSTLWEPTDIAFDDQSRVYICDRYNNRVLIFNDPLNTDRKADWVIGQTDFISNSSSITDSTFNNVFGISVSTSGDLFTVETANHRVLKFIDPVNTDKKADQVFGQSGNFTTNSVNLTSEGLGNPMGVSIDRFGNLYISDYAHHRVLAFSSPLNSSADYVYGQNGSFTSGGSGITAKALNYMAEAIVDPYGNLLIADQANHRVLIFKKTNPANILLNTAELQFGILDTALTDTLEIEIMNSGTDTLFIDSVLFTSTNMTTGNCFTVLDSADTVTNIPLDTMIVRTVFSPDSAINYSDTLTVYYRISADSSANFSKIPVNGTAFMMGDVSGDYTISAFDASLILQHTVEKIILTGDSITRADVSGNGTVRAYDAALILRYSSGIISSFPAELAKRSVESEDIPMKYTMSYDEDNRILSVPVSIENAGNIYSMEIELNHSGLEYKGMVPGDIIKDYITGTSDPGKPDGTLKFSMAGSSPVSENGTVVTFQFSVINEDDFNNFEITEILLNETEYDLANLKFDKLIPKVFKLSQNYPNPFNPETTIKYQLPEGGRVELSIYNILGQKVRTLINKDINAGYHSIKWNGRNDRGITVASGIYIYMIRTNTGYFKSKKMVFLK